MYRASRLINIIKHGTLLCGLLTGMLWCASCLVQVEYNDGDGARVALGRGGIAYRGGASSSGSVSYSLVPIEEAWFNPPRLIPLDVMLQRRLHTFPAAGLQVKWDPHLTWGTNQWPRRRECATFFGCQCRGIRSYSGFWMQTMSVAMWIPFVLAAISTSRAWKDKLVSLLAHRKPGWHCKSCAYNLTGNTSGVCPECGAPIPEDVHD